MSGRPIRQVRSSKALAPLVASGLRIGLMGGSFNPPHAGHKLVAEIALKRLALDQLWWVVSPGNPLKELSGLPSQQQRMDACGTFATGWRMRVTGFEKALGTPYTVEMLAFLRARYPDVRFVWVMGADNLASLHRWRNWREIARCVPMAVIDRPGWRMKAIASPAGRFLGRFMVRSEKASRIAEMRPPAWVLIASRLSPLSSTAMRNAAAERTQFLNQLK